MRVLGINAVFHDPAAALVVDGQIRAAAEEERFTRRKHGKAPVPFAAWEMPEKSARWCLAEAGLEPADLDAVAVSYDPALAPQHDDVMAEEWEGLRTLYAERAPRFLEATLPGLDRHRVCFVSHHVAHAASAYLAAPLPTSSVLVLDGRGEAHSHLAGRAVDGELDVLARQALPHSLGLRYEDVTAHLGFRRSSDEYKVMAMASYGQPRHLDALRERFFVTGDGGYVADKLDWSAYAPPRRAEEEWTQDHADLAASVQARVEEMLVDLARWLHDQTGDHALTLAGGVALNCVANSRVWRESPFERVWVQPAAGDAGTALGAALHTAHAEGEPTKAMHTVGLGRRWSEQELAALLDAAAVPYERPADLADTVAEILATDGVVAWFQAGSEFGPRALGHRSLLADARSDANQWRLNEIKGREQFRPLAPMVLAERAAEIFTDGPLPSPWMLFTHRIHESWQPRIPAVCHVDGTARIQTVDRADDPLAARMLDAFDQRTGVPVVINTSLNTAGRPMVDAPTEALELFGSAPVDALAIGGFIIRRPGLFRERSA